MFGRAYPTSPAFTYENRKTGLTLQELTRYYSFKCGGKMALGDVCAFLKTQLCSTGLDFVRLHIKGLNFTNEVTVSSVTARIYCEKAHRTR